MVFLKPGWKKVAVTIFLYILIAVPFIYQNCITVPAVPGGFEGCSTQGFYITLPQQLFKIQIWPNYYIEWLFYPWIAIILYLFSCIFFYFFKKFK